MYDSLSSKSSTSSKISIEHVSSILDRLQSRQTRKSTSENYLSIWRHLNKFVISLDTRENLSWEQKTALFGAYLVEGGIQSSTLKSYFSAIKHILKLDGYQWNDKTMMLDALIKSCKLENDRLKVRLPIQKGLFEMLMFEVTRTFNTNQPQPYLECLYHAVFSMLYYGMLRVGEVALGDHTLKAGNVHVGANNDKIKIVLYTFKTHGEESEPQKIKISAKNVHPRDTRLFCPVQLIIKFMTMRGHYIEDEDQYFVFTDGSPLKPDQLKDLLRKLLSNLCLDSSLYDVHSFRSDRTCDLFKYGYSIDQIKIWGRWKSNAVYRYLKNW